MGGEASRSRKRKMKLEVSKARRKSKREESFSESSEPSESNSRYRHRYRKKTKSKKKNDRVRGRNRNISSDHSDHQSSLRKDKIDHGEHQRSLGKDKTDPGDHQRSLRKDKRQERHRQQQREDLEKKKRGRKRSPSPIKQNKRRRYRSVSTCSDSSRSVSSSYSSDTCSTCNSTYNSSGNGRVKKRRSDSSRKSYRHRGLTKRNGHKEQENKKTTNTYKNVRVDNVRGDRDSESPNWKANGHRAKSRKRKRDDAVERGNILVDGQHSSEPLSSVVKFGSEGQKCVNVASDAVALEMFLRKKALENLIKFHHVGSGATKIPLSNESKRPLFVDSREVDGTDSGLCATKDFRRDEQNLTENLPDEHPTDGRGDAYRQYSKDASNVLVHDTFGNNAPCSYKHKGIGIGDKESHKESINMNKERTIKSEVAKLDEPAIGTSQECGLRTDIVSNRLSCEVLEACTSKIEESQTHMLQVDKEMQMDIPPFDVITVPSKNKISKSELTKDDKATTESLDIHASQIGVPNLDDANPPKLEGSSFQQKTMAVRQGGETVQVSYKVYIPQRSAALARRQLKR